MLPVTDDVIRQLREKHTEAQKAKIGSLLFGPVEDIPDTIHQHPNGELIREAALRIKGSGGPSGVDANGFKGMLACKSFKKSSTKLCDSLATLTRRLYTEFVDRLTIEPIVASRLVPVDKGNGEVRPIGVGEVIRRIIGKCVTRVVKQDVIDASGAMQVYTECKYGGPLGRPGSSCAKVSLVRPQEVCFDYASKRLSRSMICLRVVVCPNATN